MFRNDKFLGFEHPYNLLEHFQNKDIDSNNTFRGYFWLKLSPMLPSMTFSKICFIRIKICFNIGGGQISGMFSNFFVVKKCPFFCIFRTLPSISNITPYFVETPGYKWSYQRTTVFQQRDNKLYFSHREKKKGTIM